MDHETTALGLATPGGVVSMTGVGGLTLSGGIGWLRQTHGLCVDNVISVDIVTADGRLLRADDTSNPELFWAVRGGGGNFAIVTSFEFRQLRYSVPVGRFQVIEGIGRSQTNWTDYCRDSTTRRRRVKSAAAVLAESRWWSEGKLAQTSNPSDHRNTLLILRAKHLRLVVRVAVRCPGRLL